MNHHPFLLIPIMAIAVVLAGCASGETMTSSAVDRGDVRLTPADYPLVVIHKAETASFVELELEELFESFGFRVVGSAEAPDDGASTLAVRYSDEVATNAYGTPVAYKLTIVIDDVSTDRTLLTASGDSRPPFASREAAWNQVASQLQSFLER